MAKAKKVKLSELKEGLKVIVNPTLDNPTVYTVQAVDSFNAKLVYDNGTGELVSGGWLDYSFLYHCK